MAKEIDDKTRKFLLQSQKNEITEYHIYQKLAERTKNPQNKEVLTSISNEELRHYNIWKKYTGVEVKPNMGKVKRYLWICKIFGLTFGIKRMENGEAGAQKMYDQISDIIPEARTIIEDEKSHEDKLIELINEERLDYIGSIVLGLNDALVELTGALAGFTLAFQNTSLIAMTALITGIAASMSMAASEYLSTRSESKESNKKPLKAATYTGIAYVLTVFVLVLPYLFLTNVFLCLWISLGAGVLIIFVFTYYTSVAKSFSFIRRFAEMAIISLGIAFASFWIGNLIRIVFGISI
ncbi:MAG: rubrerythrin family protein [Promethearchaeota archaeon]|nr:MAG: rubrerythrin family protein [Candidatus Lokiarchaeota archaeon]